MRVSLLEPVGHVLGWFGQTATLKRFHDHDRNSSLVKFGVKILRIDIPDAVGMLPVVVVHLDLDEVPVVLVVEHHHVVERLLVAVE